jgi:hypothetical protein
MVCTPVLYAENEYRTEVELVVLPSNQQAQVRMAPLVLPT